MCVRQDFINIKISSTDVKMDDGRNFVFIDSSELLISSRSVSAYTENERQKSYETEPSQHKICTEILAIDLKKIITFFILKMSRTPYYVM